MKCNKSIICMLSVLFIASCGNDGNHTPYINNGELTGIWKSDIDNALYSINQDGTNVKIKICNEQSSFTLIKEGTQIGEMFKINNSSELEFLSHTGIKLIKVSNSSQFNSGAIEIASTQIKNIEIRSDVCAYREKDDIHNIISVPYLNGFLSLHLGVENKRKGLFTIPADATLNIESAEFPAGNIDATSGTVTVIDYSPEKLKASFIFIASDGYRYSGHIKVNI